MDPGGCAVDPIYWQSGSSSGGLAAWFLLALVLVWVLFLEPLPPEVVYFLFAYIRAKHFEFSPSYGWD